jgi:hypothetical protein
MKTIVLIMTVVLVFASAAGGDRFPVTEKKEFKKQIAFTDPGQAKGLVIDNIFGSIDVTGHAGTGLNLDIVKEVRARSTESLARARREVVLKITQEANTVSIVVDGPFRKPDGTIHWCRDYGYSVRYDFEVRVPRNLRLKVKTVNEGHIRVENVEGLFYVSNVNGRVRMKRVSGSGTAKTVNGGVHVEFTRSPIGACTFKTINGDVDIEFPKDLSADFRVKTFNGDMYSAFPFVYRPLPRPEAKRINGRFVYKRKSYQGIRIGEGGPAIVMDTLNGDIIINKTNNR